MEKEILQVLLATTPATPIHEIEEQLEQTIGLDCHLFQCSQLYECIDRLQEVNFHFDMILLDLTFISNLESEDFLRKIQEAAPDTPIIVFTREADRDLGLFMVGEGAAVITNPQRFKLEPDRLRDLIEHSWITHKKSRLRERNHAATLDAEKTSGANKLRDAEKSGAEKLNEKDQIISWLTGGYSVDRPSKQNAKD
jgi:DNA-binding NtrC family response regulator